MSDQQKFYILDNCINTLQAAMKTLDIEGTSYYSEFLNEIKELRTTYYNTYNLEN